jgi:signal transduction histidine kinase
VIAEECAQLFGTEDIGMVRYEGDRHMVVMASSGAINAVFPTGSRQPLEGDNAASIVFRTGRPARIDDYARASGPIADAIRPIGLRCAVATPITVEGRLWGAMITGTSGEEPLPLETESRLGQFTELMATAIANAESRAQLRASRARVIATADEARRRIQRDVHDGAQQRLVHTVVTLKLMRQALADDDPQREQLEEALFHAQRATAELRDTVRGILPAALTHGGLRAGVESVVGDLPLRVELGISVPRLAPGIETTAYFVIAEALTNVVKHASAEVAHVSANVADGALRLEIRDDGIGGADAGRGTGITGLFDRVAAADGSIAVESPPGAGTLLRVMLPLPEERG